MIAVSVFGALNNVIIFLITLRHHTNHRSGSSRLISSLSFAYALMCAVHFPISSTMTFVQFTAGTIILAVLFQYSVSHRKTRDWLAFLLAVNRVIAVCLPHVYSQYSTRKANYLGVAFSWLFSLLCVVPIALRVGGSIEQSNSGNCIFLPAKIGHVLLALLSSAPIGLTGVAYIVVGMKICCVDVISRRSVLPAVPVTTREQKQRSNFARRRMAVTRMLCCSYLFGCACTAPGYVISSVYPGVYCRDPMISPWSRVITLCEFALNPLILYFLDSDYRVGLSLLLRRRPDTREDNTARNSRGIPGSLQR
ncbi:hypothetical protein BV898_06472 [Hypsibius exemplaris]|uniref:G-protein coupled receptors family 1 profile domain-containing protein n=1 Tax=Hypsibius exemplaris TaxID=2072580 RepID=A0A1W0WWB5_HYPEX|nr:hypothetical protein BV898_06472 [Hypsibius exemplaris]